MPIPADDWRRTGQERYLRAAAVTWRRYQLPRVDWEHDHCAFCSRKFLDANYSDAAREALESDPGGTASHGYTTVGDDGNRPGYHWICRPCFDDFAEEFGWTVVASNPDAWPYEPPEPVPRPTARDQARPDDR